jgi:hypothetical protein
MKTMLVLVALGMLVGGCAGQAESPNDDAGALVPDGIYTCEKIYSQALIANLSTGGIVYCSAWDSDAGEASCCYPTGWDGGAVN